MTLENEKRFLLLLSSLMLGKSVSKKKVLDFIENQDWIQLTDADKSTKHNRNEPIWRNDLAYIRKHLEMEHLFVSGVRDDWSITEQGEQALFCLYQETQNNTSFLKIKPNAIVTAKELFSTEAISHVLPCCGDFAEGRVFYRTHLVHERNPALMKKAKERFKKEHNGNLFCEVCKFDFSAVYGILGEDFIEGHHVKPVSKMQDGDTTKVEDIVMVCSNCHSMIHRRKPWLNADELNSILINNHHNE